MGFNSPEQVARLLVDNMDPFDPRTNLAHSREKGLSVLLVVEKRLKM